jgi:exonuclease SbcD
LLELRMNTPSLKLLHTSDWHLGRSLCDRARHAEAEAFLEWLLATMRAHAVDVLLVAGDVFDSAAPGTRAQTLYYHFLSRAARLCRHIVVIAGNHDSPSFLDAPEPLLKALCVHVTGSAREPPEEEVLLLAGPLGEAELIVCAVPYLRDRDLRLAQAGEDLADKEKKLLDGLRRHYARVGEKAAETRRMLGREIPVVGMGHLFVDGSSRVADDGTRELYIGSLAGVEASVFPPVFDYLALGHLHAPQRVGQETRRYSGSPFPMGFGEAGQQKSVCLVTFQGTRAQVETLAIPVFRTLLRLQGDEASLLARLQELRAAGEAAWLEISLDAPAPAQEISARLHQAVAGSGLEILRIRPPVAVGALAAENAGESLEALPDGEVFRRCLLRHEVPEDEWPELLRAYAEITQTLAEADPLAE